MEFTMESEESNSAQKFTDVPYWYTLATFAGFAILTGQVLKALDLSHLPGIVPIGAFVGSVLSRLLWRNRRKA